MQSLKWSDGFCIELCGLSGTRNEATTKTCFYSYLLWGASLTTTKFSFTAPSDGDFEKSNTQRISLTKV